MPDDPIPHTAGPSGVTEEQGHTSGRLFRYGMLTVILALLGGYVYWLSGIPASYPYERHSAGVVVLMMLFNHLAWHFRWSPGVTRALRIFSGTWTVFGIVYVFYLSRGIFD